MTANPSGMNCPRCGAALELRFLVMTALWVCPRDGCRRTEPAPAQHEVRAAGGAPLPGLEDDES